MTYIDKSALYNKIAKLEEAAREIYLDTPNNSHVCEKNAQKLSELTKFKHMVLDFPADLDAVEVVRCRDCEHWDGGVCDVHSEWPDQYSAGHMDYTKAYDFCRYGERKTDNGKKVD